MMHHPRKRFGQHFLKNEAIIHSIIQALNPKPSDKLIEIGPGLGALTHPILKHSPQLTAIELDQDLYHKWLQKGGDYPHLTMINADALNVDYTKFGKNIRLFGNLPYNISAPLLIHFLKVTPHIQDMHFMVQKEVALRLNAQVGTKDYGRLSVMVQYHCEVTELMDVPPTAFYPEPKVDSAVVRLTPRAQSPYMPLPFQALEQLIKHAFTMRRKTIANNLKPHVSAETLQHLAIDPGWRPEQISVVDYVTLATYLLREGGYFVSS